MLKKILPLLAYARKRIVVYMQSGIILEVVANISVTRVCYCVLEYILRYHPVLRKL